MTEQSDNHILEQEIEKLSQEIIEKQKLLETKKSLEEKEIVEREIIKESLRPIIYQPLPPKTSVVPPVSPEDKNLPNYLQNSSTEIKREVEKLINLAFSQGIKKTVAQARQNKAFVLDAFHDALTDKLYEELKKRKLL